MLQKTDNIVDILKATALTAPDKTAYIFLKDGENDEVWLSYAELDAQARCLAAQLQRQNPHIATQRVLLVYPQGLEFITAFFATLYAGAIAVLVYPPTNKKMAQRLNGIIDDCDVACVLTSGDVIDASINVSALAGHQWINTDEIDMSLQSQFIEQAITPGQLAFLQYTSGSTGSPKGVMVSHDNLMANQRVIGQRMQINDKTIVVGWLPMIHDMGLIGNVLGPIYFGGTLIFMTPLHFIRKPLLWLKAISKYRATVSGGPNFAYALCAAKIRPDEIAELDLSSWRVAFNGAETVHKETIARFNATFAPAGLRPESHMAVYGLAEATLLISGTEVGELVDCADALSHVSVGKSSSTDVLKIVDSDKGIEVGQGVEGEIWYSGPSAAQGYWNNAEKTADTFRASLAGDERMYLRTGDTGYVRDGNLHVSGRLSDMIVIKGKNYHAEDIEWSINDLPGVRNSAAIAMSHGETESVVIIAAIMKVKNGKMATVADTIGATIFEDHQIQPSRVILIRLSQLPMTTSGKVRRKTCQLMLGNNQFDILYQHQLASPLADMTLQQTVYVAPRNDTEKALCDIWQQELALERVGRDDNFFDIGGNSIIAVKLVSRINKQMDSDLSVASLFSYNKIALLAEQLQPRGLSRRLLQPLSAIKDNDAPLVFAVHPGGRGGAEVYQRLANEFGNQFNCIGIDNYNMINTTKINSLRQLAQLYIQSLFEHYDIKEPVRLLGWSLGGSIALEMAYQMEQNGLRNISVCLLDTVIESPQLKALMTTESLQYRKAKVVKDMEQEGYDSSYIDNTIASYLSEVMVNRCKLSGQLAHTRVTLLKAGSQASRADPQELRLIMTMPDNGVSQFTGCEVNTILLEQRHHNNILEEVALIKQVIM